MTDYTDIIARLEAATGPDVDLNAAILLALGWTTREGIAYDPRGNRAPTIPDLVGSLDAALALVGEKLPGREAEILALALKAMPGTLFKDRDWNFVSRLCKQVLLALFRALNHEET